MALVIEPLKANIGDAFQLAVRFFLLSDVFPDNCFVSFYDRAKIPFVCMDAHG